jgi:serine/threonine protein kinase
VSSGTSSPTLFGEVYPGYQLGFYTLLERIGYGGEATVWSAWDRRYERVVAVKLIAIVEGDPFSDLSFFEQEIQLIAGLKHPNILPLHDFGSTDLFHYFTTRYIASGSLQNRLAAGPLAVEEVLNIASQIVSALEYIHERKIVHRDLKPRNILLDTRQHVYLTDFGLARALTQTTRALHTGRGTPPYSPPEQLTGARISPRSDIYSLGIMLFEMFTGNLPWNGSSTLAARQLSDSTAGLPDPREIVPDLPAGLKDALRKLTAADPSARPPSAAEALSCVTDAVRGVVPSAPARIASASRDVAQLDTGLLDAEDAQALMRSTLATWNPPLSEAGLSLTQFAFIDSVYRKADAYSLPLDDKHREFLLHGALTYGHNLPYWWQSLDDEQTRIRICSEVITTGDESAAGRAIACLLDDFILVGNLSLEQPAVGRLIDLLADAENEQVQQSALTLLGYLSRPSSRWQSNAFGYESDIRLAYASLSDTPHAARIARLIGQVRSETAVNEIASMQQKLNPGFVLPGLIEVAAQAGGLPSSLPLGLRLRVMLELAQRQLIRDRAALAEAYLFSALGGALGLGVYVYLTYRLPIFMDATRILISLVRGILIGPLIGLGIFITNLLAQRLNALPFFVRLILGTGVGTLIINLSFVAYYYLFLDVTPRGWLIAASSLLAVLGFSLSGMVAQRWLRIVISTLGTVLGIMLSWQVHLLTGLDPLLNFEYSWTWGQVALVALIVALLMASGGQLIKLPYNTD